MHATPEMIAALPALTRQSYYLRLRACVNIACRQRGSVNNAARSEAVNLNCGTSTVLRWYYNYVNKGSSSLIDRRRRLTPSFP